MKILLSTSLFPTPDDPALLSDADALGEFVSEWTKAGHEVTVLHAYLEDEKGAKKLLQLLPSIRYQKQTTLFGATVHRVIIRCMKSKPVLREKMMARAARIFNDKIGPQDVYLAHFPVITRGLPENICAGVPPIGVMHTTDNQLIRDKIGFCPDGIPVLAFRSNRIRSDYEKTGRFCDSSFIIYSGAPQVQPHAAAYREETFKILYAGKLIRRKQPDLLLRACAALPSDIPWKLTIAGAGEMEGMLKDMIRSMGLESRVEMTGPLSHEKTLEKMGETDVFSLPSYGETFGLTYLEAMSRGALAIGSRGEGIDGVMVDGENGYLLDAKDETGLTRLLEKLWRQDETEWMRVVNGGVRTAENMGRSQAAQTYLDNAIKALEEIRA